VLCSFGSAGMHCSHATLLHFFLSTDSVICGSRVQGKELPIRSPAISVDPKNCQSASQPSVLILLCIQKFQSMSLHTSGEATAPLISPETHREKYAQIQVKIWFRLQTSLHCNPSMLAKKKGASSKHTPAGDGWGQGWSM